MNEMTAVDFKNRDVLYAENIYYEPDINPEQEKSVRNYFETGDIDKYLTDDLYIEPVIATFFAPQNDIEHFDYRIKRYWEWVLINMGRESDCRKEKNLSLDEQFERTMSNLYSIAGTLFTPEFFGEVFELTYGVSYDQDRLFPITFGKESWQPKIVQKNITSRCTELMVRIDSHIFRAPEKQRFLEPGFRYTINYFISMLPLIDIECYQTELYARKHKINGKKSNYLTYQSRVRGFLAHLEGFDDDVTASDDSGLRVNDVESWQKLKDGLSRQKMPDQYYALLDFVKKHGSEARYVSE
jgi:hypothetical protein